MDLTATILIVLIILMTLTIEEMAKIDNHGKNSGNPGKKAIEDRIIPKPCHQSHDKTDQRIHHVDQAKPQRHDEDVVPVPLPLMKKPQNTVDAHEDMDTKNETAYDTKRKKRKRTGSLS